MRWRDWAFLGAATGTAMLAYGAFVEARRLVLEEYDIPLPHWPKRLDGFRIAVVGDFHIWNEATADLARRAVELAVDQAPDMVAMVGDYVGSWTPDRIDLLGHAVEPLLMMDGNAVAVPGNHDYEGGDAGLLFPIFDELNIKLLRNEAWRHNGITWIGIDSANEGEARPEVAQRLAKDEPQIVLWHEPDLVWKLSQGPALQLSGHSHGGQFVFPGGFVPMTSRNGRRYLRGFYPNAPTPIFVTRGIGTTFFPSRFNCPPEVAVLTLRSI